MNRIIKFRGKSIETNQWVYGDLVRMLHPKGGQGHFIYIDAVDEESEGRYILVHASSVGQFIGVKGYEGEYTNISKNRNEVELYEGDIVEAMSQGCQGKFLIKLRTEAQPTWMLYPAWQSQKMWSIAASHLGRTRGDYYDSLKRIGNMFDNPGLIPS